MKKHNPPEGIKADLPQVELFDTLHKLPYSLFKKIIVDGELSLLIISGEPDSMLLVTTWEDLMNSYSDALGLISMGDRVYWHTYKEYLHHKQKQTYELYLVEILEKCYVEKFAKLLYKSFGKNNEWVKLDTTDRAVYNKELQRCFFLTKSIYLNIAERKLEALRQKRNENLLTDNNKPSYDRFLVVENNLDIYFKQQFNFDNMSTAKVVDLMKRYNIALEQVEQTRKK